MNQSQAPKNVWRDVAVILIVDLAARTEIFHTWQAVVGRSGHCLGAHQTCHRLETGIGAWMEMEVNRLRTCFVLCFSMFWRLFHDQRKQEVKSVVTLWSWFCSFLQHCPMNFATQPPCVCPVPERLKLRSRWRLRSFPLRSERATPKKWSVGFLSCELPHEWWK